MAERFVVGSFMRIYSGLCAWWKYLCAVKKNYAPENIFMRASSDLCADGQFHHKVPYSTKTSNTRTSWNYARLRSITIVGVIA